jgi:transcriptional regulator with XRE-family HTH domain
VLLSYVGVYDAKPFEEYQNLSEKLREYLSEIEKSGGKQSLDILRRIEKELTIGIDSLSHPTKLRAV